MWKVIVAINYAPRTMSMERYFHKGVATPLMRQRTVVSRTMFSNKYFYGDTKVSMIRAEELLKNDGYDVQSIKGEQYVGGRKKRSTGDSGERG